MSVIQESSWPSLMAGGMVSWSAPTMHPSLLCTHCYILGYAWQQARIHCPNGYQLLELGTLGEKGCPAYSASVQHTGRAKARINNLPLNASKCSLHSHNANILILKCIIFPPPENRTVALSLPSNCTQPLSCPLQAPSPLKTTVLACSPPLCDWEIIYNVSCTDFKEKLCTCW